MESTKEYIQFVMKRKHSQLVYTTGAEGTWTELIDNFVDFLRGCGYSIAPGTFTEDYSLVPNDKLERLENAFFSGSLAKEEQA
jgi:hypothetical protein